MPAIRLLTLYSSFPKLDRALLPLVTAKQIADIAYLFDEKSVDLLAYQDQMRVCSLS